MFLSCTLISTKSWSVSYSFVLILLGQDLKLKDQKFEVSASELFTSLEHMYKNWDYRCLVPNSHKDPRKWKTYDMHDYRAAYNEEALSKVKQYKYDNNFNNWVDPEVLKSFTKSKKSMRKAWFKSYGFPYVSAVSWDAKYMSPANFTKCFQKCAKYVSSRHIVFGVY